MICPLMSYRYHNTEYLCGENCAWYSKHLQGCQFISLVFNFNKIARLVCEKPEQVKTMAQFKEKHAGKSDEEIKGELFK